MVLESLPPQDVHRPHLAMVFVVDVSGSMDPYKEELSDAFNHFIDECKKNARVSEMLDFALITFNHKIDVPVDFRSIKEVSHITFETGGLTAITEPMRKAKDMVRQRTMAYDQARVQPYKPWIILMSDGAPEPREPDLTNLKVLGSELKQRVEDKKVRVISVGVGRNYDVEVLSAVSEQMLKFENYEFMEFLEWVGVSIANVSQVVPGADAEDGSLQKNRVIPFGPQRS